MIIQNLQQLKDYQLPYPTNHLLESLMMAGKPSYFKNKPGSMSVSVLRTPKEDLLKASHETAEFYKQFQYLESQHFNHALIGLEYIVGIEKPGYPILVATRQAGMQSRYAMFTMIRREHDTLGNPLWLDMVENRMEYETLVAYLAQADENFSFFRIGNVKKNKAEKDKAMIGDKSLVIAPRLHKILRKLDSLVIAKDLIERNLSRTAEAIRVQAAQTAQQDLNELLGTYNSPQK